MQSNKTFEEIVSLSINVSNFAHGPVVMPGYVKKLEEEHRELMELFEHYGELPPPRERLEDELADNLYVIIKLANFFGFNPADLLMYATNKAFCRILNPDFKRERKDATNFPRGGMFHQTVDGGARPENLLKQLQSGYIPAWANALKNLEVKAKKMILDDNEVAEINKFGPDMVKAGVAYRIGELSYVINTDGICALSQIEENEKNLNRANLSPAGDINNADQRKAQPDINKAIKDLTELVAVQSRRGNYDFNEYMFGMANGLICALAVLTGKEPDYLKQPEEFTEDKHKIAAGKPKEGIEYFELATVRAICKAFVIDMCGLKKSGKLFDVWYNANDWEKTIFITSQDDGPEFPDKQPGADVQHSEPEYMVILRAIAAGTDNDETQNGQRLRRELLERKYIGMFAMPPHGYYITETGKEQLLRWSTGASPTGIHAAQPEYTPPTPGKILNTAIEKLREGIYRHLSNSEIYELLKKIADSGEKTQRDTSNGEHIPGRVKQ